eukprot:Nk52_evm8s258 gene=Nk52_evmTU8s258
MKSFAQRTTKDLLLHVACLILLLGVSSTNTLISASPVPTGAQADPFKGLGQFQLAADQSFRVLDSHHTVVDHQDALDLFVGASDEQKNNNTASPSLKFQTSHLQFREQKRVEFVDREHNEWKQGHEELTEAMRQLVAKGNSQKRKVQSKANNGTIAGQSKISLADADMADSTSDLAPLEFLPAYMGAVRAPSISYKKYKTGIISGEGRCFKSIRVWIESVDDNKGNVVIKVALSERKSLVCVEWILLSTLLHANPHGFVLGGGDWWPHTIELRGLTKAEMKDIHSVGVRVFHTHDSLVKSIKSIWHTLKMIIPQLAGGEEGQSILNEGFLIQNTNLRFPRRPKNATTYIPDKSQVKTGDILFAQGFTGIDIFILYMTGAKVTHTAMAMWMDDGELYVIEANGSGVRKSTWEQFHSDRQKMGMTMVFLPLSDESRANLDENAMRKFFKENEGLPYGTFNFLFMIIDTENENLYKPLSMEIFQLLFLTLEPIVNPAMELVGMGGPWTAALNHRMGTKGLKTAQLYSLMAERGLNFKQVMAMPERDEWIYPGLRPLKGKPVPAGKSMICSSMACEVLKAGGIFGELADHIQCTEMQTQDMYELAIYSGKTFPDYPKDNIPDKKREHGSYMLLYGPNEVDFFHDFNLIKPFKNMRERCPCSPPTYDNRMKAMYTC